MKETEEKYLNFDGISSEVPNDMPWGDTHWSSMSGTDWQQDGLGGTDWQDANLNASGTRLSQPPRPWDRGSSAYNMIEPPYPRGSSGLNRPDVLPQKARGSDAYNVTSPPE